MESCARILRCGECTDKPSQPCFMLVICDKGAFCIDSMLKPSYCPMELLGDNGGPRQAIWKDVGILRDFDEQIFQDTVTAWRL